MIEQKKKKSTRKTITLTTNSNDNKQKQTYGSVIYRPHAFIRMFMGLQM